MMMMIQEQKQTKKGSEVVTICGRELRGREVAALLDVNWRRYVECGGRCSLERFRALQAARDAKKKGYFTPEQLTHMEQDDALREKRRAERRLYKRACKLVRSVSKGGVL